MTQKETEVIQSIVERAEAEGIIAGDRITLSIDLELAYEHFTLLLDELLSAEPYNFAHDIIGIQNHINRKTKTFDGFFLPRYAKTDKSENL